MSEREASDSDELEFGKPLDALTELKALFERGFTVPPALRMNSVYGKFGVRPVEAAPGAVGYRAENGDWVVPYSIVDAQVTRAAFHVMHDMRRLFKIVEDEVRIIRGEARVI